MKKIITKILLILTIIFTILFIIQTVDWMINGKEYKAIDDYIEAMNQIPKTSHGKICSKNANDIYKEIIPKAHTDEEISIKYKNNDIYAETIENCKLAVEDMKKVKIPVNISSLRQSHLAAYNKINIFLVEFNIKIIEPFAKCNGEKKCLNNISKNSETPYIFADQALNMAEHLVLAKENFSIKSIFTSKIALLTLRQKRKELNQMKGKTNDK